MVSAPSTAPMARAWPFLSSSNGRPSVSVPPTAMPSTKPQPSIATETTDGGSRGDHHTNPTYMQTWMESPML